MLLALAPSSLLAPRAPPRGGVRCAAAAGGSPADALRADQDRSLIRRGERERGLLQQGTALEMPSRAAKAAKAGGARGGSAGGFGGAKAPKAKAAGKSNVRRIFSQLQPFGVESPFFVHPLIRVGSKIVTLRLQQVCRETSEPVTIVVT